MVMEMVLAKVMMTKVMMAKVMMAKVMMTKVMMMTRRTSAHSTRRWDFMLCCWFQRVEEACKIKFKYKYKGRFGSNTNTGVNMCKEREIKISSSYSKIIWSNINTNKEYKSLTLELLKINLKRNVFWRDWGMNLKYISVWGQFTLFSGTGCNPSDGIRFKWCFSWLLFGESELRRWVTNH